MATFYTEQDVDPSLIQSRKVAVIGYGGQGHAHALNLRDSGVEVRVGLHEGSNSRALADGDGFTVLSVAEATRWADVVMLCTPDIPMRDIYRQHIEPNLRPGQTLLFAHGFNIHYHLIQPLDFIGVAMVAPSGPGKSLRAAYLAGGGIPSLIAVHEAGDTMPQDTSAPQSPAHLDPCPEAISAVGVKNLALSYAWALGSARAAIIETTFKDETETDLFGEQAVLCGGLMELVKAGFDTLVNNGYAAELAYFECVHQVVLLADLIHRKGLAGMTRSISDTAEWGAYLAGPRVVNESSRAAMRALLTEVQRGRFTQEWIAENEAGLPRMKQFRAQLEQHPSEEIGRILRERMDLQ